MSARQGIQCAAAGCGSSSGELGGGGLDGRVGEVEDRPAAGSQEERAGVGQQAGHLQAGTHVLSNDGVIIYMCDV